MSTRQSARRWAAALAALVFTAAPTLAADSVSLKSKELPAIGPMETFGWGGHGLAPDGKTLYVVDQPVGDAGVIVGMAGVKAGEIKAFDTSTGKQIKPFPVVGTRLIATAPDGKTLAVLGGDPAKKVEGFNTLDQDVRIWEVPEGKLRREWAHGQLPVYSMDFSPDGSLLATFGPRHDGIVLHGNEIRLWDVASGKLKLTIDTRNKPEDNSRSSGMHFTPDGKQIAVVVGGQVRFFDTTTGAGIGAIDHGFENVMGFVFSRDGSRMLIYPYDRIRPGMVPDFNRRIKPGPLHVWDLTKKARIAVLWGQAAPIAGACFSPSGKSIIAADEGDYYVPNNANLQELLKDRSPYLMEWDAKTFKLTRIVRGKLPDDKGSARSAHVAGVNNILVSHDGTTMAYNLYGGFKLWSTRRGKAAGPEAFSPGVDGKLPAAATGGEDADGFRTWRLKNAKSGFEARLVERTADGKVVLEKKSEQTITVALGKLSDEDQAYLKAQEAAEKKADEEKAKDAAGKGAKEGAAEVEPFRTWRLKDAKNGFEARLVEEFEGQVVLEKKNGQVVTVQLGKLSDEDQIYVKTPDTGPKDRR